MPRKKRSSSPLELYDDDFDEDASSQSSQPPVQRNAANARERMRMRVLSSAYGRLKTKLPNIPPDTKLSKLDTLRLATLYIKQLITAVENGSNSGCDNNNGVGGVSNAAADALDASHLSECGGTASGGSFTFHNGGVSVGHASMSWPFEFHQHFPHGSRNLAFSSSRLDWQAAPSTHVHNKPQRLESYTHASTMDMNYTHLQDAHRHNHWYPTSTGMEPIHGSCAYESFGQQARTQAHS